MKLRKIFAATCLVWGTFAQAQMPGTSVSIGQVHLNEATLSGGGKASVDNTQISFSHTGKLSPSNTLGLQLRGDHEFWSFDGTSPTLWKDVQRFSLGLPMTHSLSNGWSMMLTPRAEWAGEEDAGNSDSLAWGVMGAASKQFGQGQRLGIGLTLSRTLDDKTEAFPFFLVDWRFNEQWRLFNPLGLGLSGPAGLELAYRVAPSVELGLGSSWRNSRFRLADSNATAGGVGQFNYVPVFLHLSWKPTPVVSLDAYAGMLFNGRLKTEDRNGNSASTQYLDNTPAFGIAGNFRF